LSDDSSTFEASKRINYWLKEFGIGDYLSLSEDKETGKITPFIYKNEKKQTLSELGFGFIQLIPIILATSFHNTIFFDSNDNEVRLFISEPESHLHPNLQSKLGDLFNDYVKNNGTLIIETHSEYLIRKLQYLTAKKDIKPEDTRIYYFHDPNNIPKGEKQIKELTIREDGMMDDDFGPGFFDESTRLTMDLLKLQSRN
jgi:predicted ATPase